MATPGVAETSDVEGAASVARAEGETPADQVEEGKKAGADTGPEVALAPELVKRLASLGERVRGAGLHIPEITTGPRYHVSESQFEVPLEQSVERAEKFKSANVDDFVLGELLVHFARTQSSEDRFDSAVVNNPALKIAIELTDTVAAARLLVAKNPELEGPVRHYVTTLWSKVADQMSASSAPKNTRALLITLVASTFPDARLRPGKITDEVKELLKVASEAFDELTKPPEGDALDTALTFDAKTLGKERRSATKDHLWPIFAQILTMELPEPEKPKPRRSSGEQARVVSAAEARKDVERRRDTQEQGAEKDVALERFLTSLKREPLWKNAQRGSQVSPSEVRRYFDNLVSRGTLPDSESPDRFVSAALAALGQFGKSERSRGFAEAAVSTQTAAWEPSYLTPLSGPKLEELFEPIPSYEQFGKSLGLNHRHLEAPTLLGRSMGFADEKSHYRAHLRELSSRLDELKHARQIARAFADGDGLSAAIGQRLDTLQTAIVDTLDRTSETVEAMGRGGQFSTVGESRRSFEHGKRYIERLFLLHDAVIDFLSDVPDNKSLLGGLFGSSDKKPVLTLEACVGRIQALDDKHARALSTLESAFRDYPNETEELRALLEPRLEWRAQNLKRDPTIVLSDATWLPIVAAELERALLSGAAIEDRVGSLPEDFPGRARFVAELDAVDDLRAVLVADVASVLHQRLSGTEDPGVESASSSIRITRLPPMARHPHLAALAVYGDVMELDLSREVHVDGLTAGLFRSPRFPAVDYDPSEHAAQQRSRLADATDNFSFWCRSVDLGSKAEALATDLEAWGVHFAASARELLVPPVAERVLDTPAAVLEHAYHRVQTPSVHPAVDDASLLKAVGELRESLKAGGPAEKITAQLSWPDQPVAVLLQLSRDVGRAAKTPELLAAALEGVESWFESDSPELRQKALQLMSRHHEEPAEEVVRAALSSESLSTEAQANIVHDIATG
ncbi:MAG: hypothetical protein AAF658_02485, partial [Myxococcota bacterium]